MLNKFATALEIGSSKLRVVVARKGVNDTFNVIESSETAYDGYFQGEFVDSERLKMDLAKIFEDINYITKKYNKKLYVGLPAEFVGVEVVSADINFDGYKKITKNDLKELYQQAAEKIDRERVEIISTTPIQFSIDEGGRILSDPIGKKARQISAEISVVIAEKEAIQKFNDIFSDLGFSSVEYVSETLTQAMFVIPKEEREQECLLIDVGNLSTSISFVKGDGLVSLTAYSLGGGYITGDLCEAFNITYKDAEKLKKQMVISVKGDRSDFYDLVTDQSIERINVQEANNIAIDRIEEIGRAINQCVQNYSLEYIGFLPSYLSGAALTKLKGGRDYISKCMGRNVTIATNGVPGIDKPENNAVFGILNYALNQGK